MKTEQIKMSNFAQGYMCACATMLSINGLNTGEKEVFDAFGKADEQTLINYGVDEHDLRILKDHKLI